MFPVAAPDMPVPQPCAESGVCSACRARPGVCANQLSAENLRGSPGRLQGPLNPGSCLLPVSHPTNPSSRSQPDSTLSSLARADRCSPRGLQPRRCRLGSPSRPSLGWRTGLLATVRHPRVLPCIINSVLRLFSVSRSDRVVKSSSRTPFCGMLYQEPLRPPET